MTLIKQDSPKEQALKATLINAVKDSSEYFDPSALSVPSIFPASNGTGARNYITQPGTFGNG